MKLNILLIFIFLSLNVLGQEAAFDGTQELTLDEEQASETYIHQGVASTTNAELCENGAEGIQDICTDTNAFSGGLGRTLEALIPAVTKAYTLIMTATGSKLKKNKSENGEPVYKKPEGGETTKLKEAGENPKRATDEKTDYCQYIAVAGETLSMAMSQMQNQQTQQNYEASKPEARQAAAFYSLAKNHKDQAKASKIQMGVWGATGGCYAALLATGAVSGDFQLYAKAGGAALIAVFYKKKADAHKKRARLLEEMAKKLPQAGDCNPYTQTTCFCNEETSFAADQANYMKFCVPEPLMARNKFNDAVTCVDAKRANDPNCNCVAQNNCIDRVLKTGALNFGVPPTLMRDPLAGLKPLSEGFGTGDLDNVTNRNLAAVNKALEGYKPTNIGDLTNAQKEIAKTISENGIPGAVAATIAKRGGSGSLPSSFSSGLAGGDLMAAVPTNGLTGNSKKNNSSGYQSGNSVRSKNRSSSGPFLGRNQRSKTNKGGVDIDDQYAVRAQREAEIVKDPGVNIFQVINNRYQSSAWRQFPEALIQED